jgi:transposase InsO family protein
MRANGIERKLRGRKRRTTIPDETAVELARDLLQRGFTAARPNEKWVCDLTYIRAWNGFVYLAFILDCYSRKIVGWQLQTHMRAERQYTSIRYTDRLDELEIAPSVGSKGDAYDNAMAEPGSRPSRASASTGAASRASSTPNTRPSNGSASTTMRDCTKHSVTCRPPSTRN